MPNTITWNKLRDHLRRAGLDVIKDGTGLAWVAVVWEDDAASAGGTRVGGPASDPLRALESGVRALVKVAQRHEDELR